MSCWARELFKELKLINFSLTVAELLQHQRRNFMESWWMTSHPKDVGQMPETVLILQKDIIYIMSQKQKQC